MLLVKCSSSDHVGIAGEESVNWRVVPVGGFDNEIHLGTDYDSGGEKCEIAE